MAALDQLLVRRKEGSLVLLFSPPFGEGAPMTPAISEGLPARYPGERPGQYDPPRMWRRLLAFAELERECRDGRRTVLDAQPHCVATR